MLSDDPDLTGMTDEFGLLTENAEQAGVCGPLPAVRRIAADGVSALHWGDGSPRVVFLHGGGQNAHTWDTVIIGLGVPALAVDLPGHGHSTWRADGDYSPQTGAAALEPLLRDVAPDAELIVGMSLGALTAIGLGALAPQLVRRLVLVDATPSATRRLAEMSTAQQGTVALLQADREFATFAEMVALTAAAAPNRDPKAVRRGVFHNARQLENGRWTWRYDIMTQMPDFDALWNDIDGLAAPITLVRAGTSPFVTDDDAAELGRRARHFSGVHVVADAGHSVQSDQPVALTRILRGVLAG